MFSWNDCDIGSSRSTGVKQEVVAFCVSSRNANQIFLRTLTNGVVLALTNVLLANMLGVSNNVVRKSIVWCKTQTWRLKWRLDSRWKNNCRWIICTFYASVFAYSTFRRHDRVAAVTHLKGKQCAICRSAKNWSQYPSHAPCMLGDGIYWLRSKGLKVR